MIRPGLAVRVDPVRLLYLPECNSTGVKCGNCDKRSIQSFYCFQCFAFWCDDCITGHNIIRANKEHRVLALTDFQDQEIEDVLKRPAFCPTPGHEKKEMEFFCKICEVAICNACALTDHEGHAKIRGGSRIFLRRGCTTKEWRH